MLYKGSNAIKAFKGDYAPVNIYKGNTKISGWEYEEVSGTSLNVANTYNDDCDLTICGKSQQLVTVQGINLFDSEDWYSTLNTVSSGSVLKVTVGDVEYYKFNGSSTYKVQYMKGQFVENTQYTLTFKGMQVAQVTDFSTGLVFQYTDGTNSSGLIAKDLNERHYKLTSTAGKTVDHIRTSFYNTGYVYVRDIQLTEGTTVTEYTPFVPNSPTPNYPSPINSVTNFSVVNCGRNLFSSTLDYGYSLSIKVGDTFKKIATANKVCSSSLVKVLSDTDYVFSQTNGAVDAWVVGYDKNGILVADGTGHVTLKMMLSKNWTSTTATFKTTPTTHYVAIYNTESNEHSIGNIQLELGSTATAYSPYRSDSTTVTATLRGIEVPSTYSGYTYTDGTKCYVADYVYAQYDRAYKVQNIGNGFITQDSAVYTKDWRNSATTFGVMYRSGSFPSKPYASGAVSPVLSSCFQATSYDRLYAATNCGISVYNSSAGIGLVLRIDTAYFENYDTYYSSLATNPIEVQYILNTPITTDITDTAEGQALLQVAKTYYPQTNISTNANILPMLEGKFKVRR